MRIISTRLTLSILAGLLLAGTEQTAFGQDNGGTDLELRVPNQIYLVGPGDILDVSVYDEEDLTRLVTVQHGGEISFPLIGEVYVDGLTVKEVKQQLTELLGKDFLVAPQLTVTVKEYLSQWLTVAGEVARPGKYYLEGPKTLLELLTEAGGFSDEASGEIVISQFTRTFEDGTTSMRVKLSPDMSPTEQRNSLALSLADGDLITVSARTFIYISGEVNKPGPYPLTSGLTVLEAVSLCGGISKFGSKGKVEILRKSDSGTPERIKVDISGIEKGKKVDIPLVVGDIIKVGKRIF